MEAKRIEIFIAFDRKDTNHLIELRKHLKFLEDQEAIAIWDASEIRAGERREQVITARLNAASIILLLVSADFMASSEGSKLIKQAVARGVPPEVYVVPVILNYVYLGKGSDISGFERLPTNGEPISHWSDKSAAYVNIVEGIEAIITTQQQAFAEEAGGDEVKEVIVDAEDLKYNDEDQPWFATEAEFPKTLKIGQEQVDALREEIDVVIMTATDKELDAVMHLVGNYPGRKSVLQVFVETGTYYLGKFGMYKAVITMCRQGSVGENASLLATSHAINVWNPRTVIMAGIAFGKDPAKQKIADVMVATEIIPYERQRVGEKPRFRAPIPPSNATLLDRFRRVPSWHFTRPDGKDCVILPGPLLSGEKLVDNLAYKAQLFQPHPDAIGGEMEGAGVCSAAGSVNVPWILVKSICDWGDGKKHKRYQPLAAAASASLVHHVLSQNGVLNGLQKRNLSH